MAAMFPVPVTEGPRWPIASIVLASVLLATAGGPVVAAFDVTVLALLTVPTLLIIALRPACGAYLYLFAAPLVTGISRGTVMPLMRLNEVLLVLITASLGLRVVALSVSGRPYRPSFGQVDLALVLLASTGSVIPLLIRFGRDMPISTDDLLYAIVLWKLYLLYRLFLYAVSKPTHVANCLVVAMLSAVLVTIIAALQVLDLFDVPRFLWTYYDRPFEGETGLIVQRGTSTLASSFAVADMMVMNAAVVLAWLCGGPGRWRLVPVAVGGVFIVGCMASGQFSGVIGLLAATLAIGIMAGQLRRIIAAISVTMVLGAVLFWPVVERRLDDFGSVGDLPPSWIGRLDNLERFIWPELSDGINWIVGVRPAARVPAPEPWRDWIYIESGYMWLLWTGGLPMLAAFLYFTWSTFRVLSDIARNHVDEAVRITATATIASLVMLVTLMLFDPHLTIRGSADLFFALLALSMIGGSPTDRQRTRTSCDFPSIPREGPTMDRKPDERVLTAPASSSTV